MSKAKLMNKMVQGRIYGRERGEMPIGPVLIIALIVLPLVLLLLTYGGQIAESFTGATAAVSTAQGTATIATRGGDVTAPGGGGDGG